MTTIELVANDQLLQVTVNPTISSGEQNTVEVHVDFSDDWDGFSKSAVFFTSLNKNAIYEIVMTDGKCVVPSEVMEKSCLLYVGVRGVNSENNEVKTTSLVKYKILEGTPTGNSTEVEPTPDVYQQLLTAYGKTDNSINKEKAERQAEIAVERARIDNLSTLTEGSTTADAELLDIRVKADGSTATSAGNAVREQVSELKSDLSDVKNYCKTETFDCNYSVSESGYRTDGSRVGWSDIWSTDLIDCNNVHYFIFNGVGSLHYNASIIFPSVLFYDSDKNIIKYIDGDVQLNGKQYTFSGMIAKPTNARYVAFNKTLNSENKIEVIYHALSVNNYDLLTYSNAKSVRSVNGIEVFNDAEKSMAKIRVSGDATTLYSYGKNLLEPFAQGQTIVSNGVTLTIDENGVAILNGTNTSENIAFNKVKFIKSFKAFKGMKIVCTAQTLSNGAKIYTFSAGADYYVSNLRGRVTLDRDTTASESYIYLSGVPIGTVFNNEKLLLSLSASSFDEEYYLPNGVEEIKHTGGTKEYDVMISEGCAIYNPSENTSVTVVYNKKVDDYRHKDEYGVEVFDTPVNPDWWGWNTPDGEAFFRYNCDKNRWPQYKEVNAPMLVRGALVVGYGKQHLGGDNYKSQYPARYGYHIFEGVGRESDHHRLTMLGGAQPNTASIFYFATPYDGDDTRGDSDPYGWVQLGDDKTHSGCMFRGKATRFYAPLTFSSLSPHAIESSTDTVLVGNKTEEVKTKYEDDVAFKNNVDTEELYPVGTMYYSTEHGTIRVKTPNGWKSVVLE